MTEQEIAENELYQEYIDLGVNIQIAASNLTLYANTILKEFQLTFQQYNVLRILSNCSPQSVTVKYISERMIDRSSNASRLVEKLVIKKLVIREVSSTDKRSVNISINEAGAQLLGKAAQALEPTFFEQMSNRLTIQEAGIANNVLVKLRK